MGSLRLFLRLTGYYGGVTAIVIAALWLFPGVREFLPIGGAEALITQQGTGALDPLSVQVSQVENFRESLLWLIIAIAGALLTALPVSWTYMEIRNLEEYDQSLVETIIILPIAVTSIVILVHNSLALAFSLAGIVGGVRFRNTLKSSGDALFVLLAIGIGLAAGVGAMELAIVMSVAFNYCFLGLWVTDYGARKGTHRYLRKSHVAVPCDQDGLPMDAGGPVAVPAPRGASGQPQ